LNRIESFDLLIQRAHMTTDKPQNILNYIINITEQRDAELLEESLTKTIYDVFAPREVLFCKTLHKMTNPSRAIIINEHGTRIVLESTELVSIGNMLGTIFKEINEHGAEPKFINIPEPVIVYPVMIMEQIIGFVAIYTASSSSIDNDLVRGLLRVYHNYLTLLAENQRDRLTGLLNRKTFDDQILKIIEYKKLHEENTEDGELRRRSIKYRREFWLGIMDIDDFKKINDTFGHLYGDDVLILIARLMTKYFRHDDLLFRYGGEEFVVILESSSRDEAISVFERFRKAVASYGFPQELLVTVSTGVVQITPWDVPTTFVGHADQALYYAKNSGKNRICVYEDLVADGSLKSETRDGGLEFF